MERRLPPVELNPRQRAHVSRTLAAASYRVAGTLFYAAVLHWTYSSIIAPNYAYSGLTYRPPNASDYGTMLVATAVVAVLLPARIQRTSEFIQWMVFIIAGAPSMLLAQYSTTLSPDDATTLGMMVAITTLLIRVGASIRPRSLIPEMHVPARFYWGLLVLMSLAAYVALIATTGLDIGYLSFSDVYAVRADYKAALAGVPLLGYILPTLYAVINPIFMARGIYGRGWANFAYGAVGQLIIYLTTGHKLAILSVPAMLGLALLFRRDPQSLSPVRLVLALAAIMGASTVVDRLRGGLTFTALFSTRLVAIPGALTAAYVMVFQDRPKMLFSSFLPGVDSPYTTSPFHMVGEIFFRDAGNNANVNLFGDGYLNYGYVGMLIEGLALVVLLWMADDVTTGLSLPISAMVFALPAMALTNGGVFTSILTYGFGAALVLCAAMPRQRVGRGRSHNVRAAVATK